MENKRKGLSAPGILTVLALVLLPILLGVFLMPGGGGSGAYNSYGGPVLPMTALSGGEHLEVKRNVDFDFSDYARERENILDTGMNVITDTYELANTSGEEVTVELAYGFEGQFTDPAEQFPSITVGGNPVQTTLIASVDPEGALHRAKNWDTYKQVLTEEDFLTSALSPALPGEFPVTALRFSNVTYDQPEQEDVIHYGIQFTWPEDTDIWVRDYGMTTRDDKTKQHQLYFREDMGDGWMFVRGQLPEDITYVGVSGYNIRENTILQDVTMEMEVSETDLYDCLWEFAQVYDFWAIHDGYDNPGVLTPEILYGSALQFLQDPRYHNPSGDFQALSSVLYEAVTNVRMLYSTFSVTIPAGESVTVEAVFTQEPSTDIGGPRIPREGYDMATTFGSCLNFTEQTASVTGSEYIEIVKQNFGFDLKKKITQVVLDLSVERYFLDVAMK